jgi:hypothetical protein
MNDTPPKQPAEARDIAALVESVPFLKLTVRRPHTEERASIASHDVPQSCISKVQ